MRTLTVMCGVFLVLALAGEVSSQAVKEFDWLPCGTITVSDADSRAESVYECDSVEPVEARLVYQPGGAELHASGRKVLSERFTVQMARFRGGAARGTLVIQRLWDTGEGMASIALEVDGRPLPEWTVSATEGGRRWVDLFYAVSPAALCDANGNPKGQVTISLIADRPLPSYEYTLYVTRDWDLLGEEYAGPVAPRPGSDPRDRYVTALVDLGAHDYASAASDFGAAAGSGDPEMARLARRMVRWATFRQAAAGVKVERTPESFQAHRALALYASANGFRPDALDEWGKAVTSDPTNPLATYRWAEAMEYCGYPPSAFAPIMERSGDLYNRKDTNIIDVYNPIQAEAYENMCGKISEESIEALFRDWRLCEQMIRGATRGAWKIRTTYQIYTDKDPKWIMHLGWLFGPPDECVPVRGTYDYSNCFAEYGSSDTGGVDCGVNGAGESQTGPTRSWEVILHEWNHQFDWTRIAGEQAPGYPVTHDSDGCGKQPIVNMGCGHRSSMYYYVSPAEYRRIEGSDPEIPGNHIKVWSVGGLTALPVPAGADADAIAKWAVDKKWITQDQLNQWKQQWESDRQNAAGAGGPAPTWNERFTRLWNGIKILDGVVSPKEQALAADPKAIEWKPLDSRADFVDLLAPFPNAPDKCVCYAQTFVWSPRDQEVRMWLGYNDVACVWVNGRKVHTGQYYACAKWEDAPRTDMVANHADLKQGWNRIVVKVERGGGGWGFSVGLVTYDNTPVEGLKYQAASPNAPVAKYVPPQVGPHYKWADVQEDYIELLPTLTQADLRKLTGIPTLACDGDRFFLDGVPQVAGAPVMSRAEFEALLAAKQKLGQAVAAGTTDVDPDTRKTLALQHRLDNFLDWDYEAAAAVRFSKDGAARDLLLVRPEYFEEYLALADGGCADRILGTMMIENPAYESTPNRASRRYVLVVDAALGGYPIDEQDLLRLP